MIYTEERQNADFWSLKDRKLLMPQKSFDKTFMDTYNLRAPR